MLVQVAHEPVAAPESVSLPKKRKTTEEAAPEKNKQTRQSSSTASSQKAAASTTGDGEPFPSRLWIKAGRFLVCNLQAVQFSKQ